jgi:hypothetical protein
VLEEADESLLWLEVINEAEVYSGPRLQKLLKEADELRAISSSLKTVKIPLPEINLRSTF